MNAAAKQWVAALRSGEYKQGNSALRTGDKYCCLGVACDLAVKAKIIPEPFIAQDGTYWYGTEEKFESCPAGDNGYMPKEVMQWVGLRNPYGGMPAEIPLADFPSLTGLNDSFGKNFLEIADHIEQYEADLFVE